ncbi:hypothetical protein QYF36_023116 [Acer negundo]|nr:hypothetical protein QYF36_023116 [Acer negundo]
MSSPFYHMKKNIIRFYGCDLIQGSGILIAVLSIKAATEHKFIPPELSVHDNEHEHNLVCVFSSRVLMLVNEVCQVLAQLYSLP